MINTPLRIVVGFSPGSASDDIARLVAKPLSEALGRPVELTRIAGENGAHAAREVARSAPDGNTLFVATLGTHALAPHVRRDLPYDPLRDFVPVSLLTQSPMLLACYPAQPFTDVQGLIAHTRAHPCELAYGTSAIGGAPHLAAALFQNVSGVKLRRARYDDTRKLYADLEAGRIALSFNNIMSMLPRCRAGKLHALGVTAATRSNVAPEVPTFSECGLPGCDMSNWVGLVAPQHTPAPIVEMLSKTSASAVRKNEVSTVLNAAGITPCGSTAAEFGDFIAAELRRWKSVAAGFSQA